MNYESFLSEKRHVGALHGFKPTFLPDALFDFQAALVTWAVRKGRAALFEDCGLGKTLQQLVWAENVVRHTNRSVLILTPLAVAGQTVKEGAKFGIDCRRCGDGKLEPGAHIVVANYQRLHLFNPSDFAGLVCDESSILKNFDGATKAAVTEFARKVAYRLLCTATAAPNDYIELGTSSEALGELGFMDMLNKFFKKQGATTSRSDEHRAGIYRFRGHAEHDFWRWVCSWARAMRKPSDMGFDDGRFVLPKLTMREHVVTARAPREGMLFDLPASGLKEEREERRRTIEERCELAASLVNPKQPSVLWCNMNDEGKLLKQLIKGSVEISGEDTDEAKEEAFEAFSAGKILHLITKSKIAAWGLNWQHCAHQTFFASHSFEQLYQCTRRSWRFGQEKPVTVDMIACEGEVDIVRNFQRKADAAERMFEMLVALMNDELHLDQTPEPTTKTKLPSWL